MFGGLFGNLGGSLGGSSGSVFGSMNPPPFFSPGTFDNSNSKPIIDRKPVNSTYVDNSSIPATLRPNSQITPLEQTAPSIVSPEEADVKNKFLFATGVITVGVAVAGAMMDLPPAASIGMGAVAGGVYYMRYGR